MDVSLLEQVKIQAQVLVPLVKAFQAELGEERANAIIRRALGSLYRDYGDAWWRAQQGADVRQKLASTFAWFAGGNALDYEVVKQSSDAFDVNVTGCRYAEFFKHLGAPELGFLLVCSADFALIEGFGDGVGLSRKQTIMQGASHCDFRFTLKS